MNYSVTHLDNMNFIENFFEPSRLLLIWQLTEGDGTGYTRSRRVVAEIVKSGVDNAVFRYLVGTPDYDAAIKDGFKGYSAFKLGSEVFAQGVIEAFIRRLPPRKREDFDKYLNMHRLPSNFKGSDMALLGYTGARLPSDSFEITPDYSDALQPLDFVIEVAGFRYHNVSVNELEIGDKVEFILDAENQYDKDAVAIYCNQRRIGHVPRPILPKMSYWIKNCKVSATIERLNGKPERPLVYLFVKIGN